MERATRVADVPRHSMTPFAYFYLSRMRRRVGCLFPPPQAGPRVSRTEFRGATRFRPCLIWLVELRFWQCEFVSNETRHIQQRSGRSTHRAIWAVNRL